MHLPLHFTTTHRYTFHPFQYSLPYPLPLTVPPPVHTIRSFCKIKVVSQYQLSEGILDFLPLSLSLSLQLPCTHTHTHRHVRTNTNTCTCVASSLPSVSYRSLFPSVSLALFFASSYTSPLRTFSFACSLSRAFSRSPASFLFISNWYLVASRSPSQL